jgi:hypothetical protein
MDRESLTPVANSQFYTAAVSSIASMLNPNQSFGQVTNEKESRDVMNNNINGSGTPSIVSLPSPPVFELTEEVILKKSNHLPDSYLFPMI